MIVLTKAILLKKSFLATPSHSLIFDCLNQMQHQILSLIQLILMKNFLVRYENISLPSVNIVPITTSQVLKK